MSSSALVLLPASEQQCSVDAVTQSSTVSPHQRVRQIVPTRLIMIMIMKKDAQCAVSQSWKKSRSVKRHERMELCSPHQYLSGRGAHRPASATATPEIRIMSGPQTTTASKGRAWSLSCPLSHRYSAHGIHPSTARIESLTHNPPLPRVSMSVA